eukprot:CAMPEP_0206267702 /NCGR_PEP_ID=MMETSP0047_2-20121206/31298_1 /ASSEMBLY_ACC=CAM_ASM_000192 /TAXON_ID=195065 /ORGANISM="Chroomonas mesostigmatica_cf, Strain CCMP1168" /LENGTH=71 /DNA_ID=CAMNT_0053695939 /DNA_START=89 /DNA_END=301 /DNA_ORIENTATION=+
MRVRPDPRPVLRLSLPRIRAEEHIPRVFCVPHKQCLPVEGIGRCVREVPCPEGVPELRARAGHEAPDGEVA